MSAMKTNFVLYDLPFHVFDHPKVKYFIKAIKLNRPLNLKSHNVITIPWLIEISKACEAFNIGVVYRAAFLLGFFAFLRLSNVAPHAIAGFRFHLTSYWSTHILYQKTCYGLNQMV